MAVVNLQLFVRKQKYTHQNLVSTVEFRLYRIQKKTYR